MEIVDEHGQAVYVKFTQKEYEAYERLVRGLDDAQEADSE